MNRETILVVEDNDALREGLRDILSSEGYTVITALDGLDALEQMKMITPDIILSDIAMPRLDGYNFFQTVRSRPEWLTIPFMFLTARGEKQDIISGKNLGAEDYLVKPLTREELLTAVIARLSRSQELRTAQLQRAYESSLTMLANAIDVRDVYTRGHVERVTAYAMVIATEAGLSGRALGQLRFGAILHDIGKIITRETTLFKKAPLNDEEWDEIKIHPVTGAEMIKHIAFLAPAVPVVRHHHERWDGAGYPDGLSGEAIPIGARIVAVADSFDSMTIHCPYRAALTLERAFQEIHDCTGTRYDPTLVAAFQRAWHIGKIQAVRAEWEARI
jgi:putative two-component system response regulator